MLYLLHTLPGLGQLAWREAEAKLPVTIGKPGPSTIGIRLVPRRNDIVLLRYAGDPKALLRLRVSEDVFAVAARAFSVSSDERGLRQIYAAVRNSRFVGDALNAWKQATASRRLPATFRVVAREVGEHYFMRRAVGKAVADAVTDGWPGRWQKVDEEADLEVWASLLEKELFCAVRLSGLEMRQRGKQHHLPASLRPAMAAAMVFLTDPAPDDVFLDPMAGAGTLLAERAAAGPFRQIYGGDINAKAVEAMRANTRSLKGAITCERWDAGALPLEDESVDKVAVNLPFGKQIAPGNDLVALYGGVLAEIQRVLRPDGRLVALVGESQALNKARSAAPQLRPGPNHRVTILGQAAAIRIFDKRP
ncbi:MAG: RNA methyltransferase [Chloroflexales bacterium]|nr:RNA methyltransferase [Chloroflexales bacterium]